MSWTHLDLLYEYIYNNTFKSRYSAPYHMSQLRQIAGRMAPVPKTAITALAALFVVGVFMVGFDQEETSSLAYEESASISTSGQLGDIPPEGITVQQNGAYVTIDWQDAPSATRYLIVLYVDGRAVEGLFVADSVLVNKKLTPSVEYTIKAFPYAGSQQGMLSTLAVVTVGETSDPDPPTGLAPDLDVTPPTVTLNGPSTVSVAHGSTYTDRGAACIDDTDPYPTLMTRDTVDTLVSGSYYITYTCTDDAGNTAIATRVVNVALPTTVTPTPSPPPPPTPTPPTSDIAQLIGVVESLAEIIHDLTQKITALETKIASLEESLNTPAPPALADSGDFIPVYFNASGGYNSIQQSWYEERQFLEEFTARLSHTLALPHDIAMVMDECGYPGAYYSSGYKYILICYELATALEYDLSPFYSVDEELFEAIDDALTWIILHELGHALVDAYDLPITGKEEDAVDQFATIIAIEYLPPHQRDSVLSSILLWFFEYGDQYVFSESLAGVHSLNAQRHYNIGCWVYGSDPHAHSFLVDLDLLPESRASTCQSEYELMSESWYKLVSPFLLNPGSVSPP